MHVSVTSSAECHTVTRIPAEVYRYTSITVIPMHQNCHCATNPSVNWETDSVKFKERYIYICQISDIFIGLFCIIFSLCLIFHTGQFSVNIHVFAFLKHFASSSLRSIEILIGLFLIFQMLTGHYHYYLFFFQFHLCLECCPQMCAKSTKKGPV